MIDIEDMPAGPEMDGLMAGLMVGKSNACCGRVGPWL